MGRRWNATIALLLAAIPCTGAPRRQTAPAAHKLGVHAVEREAQPELKPGDGGPGVVRAQILLSRAHFSPGEIDGHFGINLRKAVRAYQDNRKLPVTGRVDTDTWAALNADAEPLLTEYAIADEDIAGPFVKIPLRIQDQAALPALGYSSPLEALSEKFHLSPALLVTLNPAADFSRAGESLIVPNVITDPPGPAARIVVSKSERSIRAYDEEDRLLAFYPVTAGSEHDPLPIGEWKVNGVGRNPVFHYNPKLFWDARPGDSRKTIPPGPNNPVGLVWIDLSKEHIGIHGTPEPSKVGHTYSHGCIRLTNWDALDLASMVRPGTPATLAE